MLNWYLVGVGMNLGQAHKARFWCTFLVFSKFSDEHSHHFYRGVHPVCHHYSNTGLPLRLQSARVKFIEGDEMIHYDLLTKSALPFLT